MGVEAEEAEIVFTLMNIMHQWFHVVLMKDVVGKKLMKKVVGGREARWIGADL